MFNRMIRQSTKSKNPYLKSYLSMAIAASVLFIGIFSYIIYSNYSKMQFQKYQKEIEALSRDMEQHIMSQMQDAAFKISYKREFKPFILKRNKYNEMVLLESFEQYRSYSVLADECILYYSGWDHVFSSIGNTIGLDVYLEENGISEELWAHFTEPTDPDGNEARIEKLAETLYFIYPLHLRENGDKTSAVLIFMADQDNLTRRFEMILGEVDGNLSFYQGDTLLYCNQETACRPDQKKVLSARFGDDVYTICYMPGKMDNLLRGFPMIQIFLVLTDVLLLFAIAYLFARKAYSPILSLANKYREDISLPENIKYENALEEMGQIMDNMLNHYVMANAQLEQKRDILQKQVLRNLLNGSYVSQNIESYLKDLQIHLPGPFYYAATISFEKENVTEDFLNRLKTSIEQLTDKESGTYVYALCVYEQKRVNVVCSILSENNQKDLTECIYEIASSFEYQPETGIGGVCDSLTRLPSSWLESMEHVHSQLHFDPGSSSADHNTDHIYDPPELHRITAAMVSGDEDGAIDILNQYTAWLEENPIPLLTLKYIFAKFFSETTELSQKNHITLHRQGISLLVSASSAAAFRNAMSNVIRDFCEKKRKLQEQTDHEISYQIYEYVNTHFAEYDMSIEKTAETLNVSPATVRQAILKHSGKMYKDYVIYLRIEYAKQLLLTGNITVSETCQRVGYGSLSYFIQVFKEMTGVTPSRFRSDGGKI